MSTQSTASSGGIGLGGLLGLAFIVLKLCHVINWSWWMVTLPLWGGIAIVFAIMGMFLLFAGLLAVIAMLTANRY